jgi:hypothetical protein
MRHIAALAAIVAAVSVAHAATGSMSTRASDQPGSSPDVAYVNVPAAAFVPADREPESRYFNRGTTLDILCSEDAQYFVAPVGLPSGAELSSLTLIYRSDHSDAFVGADLSWLDLAELDDSLSETSRWKDEVVSVSDEDLPTGTIERLRESVTQEHSLLPSYSYYVTLGAYCSGEWSRGAAVYVFGVRVGYRYPVAVPLSLKHD